MKFIWEEQDITGGLRIIQPEKGTTATIAWFGLSGDRRSTIVETNTDGMIHGQHKKKKDGSLFHDMNGELVFTTFTCAELAQYLNEATYQWVPASIFTGTGRRLKTDGRGEYHNNTKGLRKIGEIRG